MPSLRFVTKLAEKVSELDGIHGEINEVYSNGAVEGYSKLKLETIHGFQSDVFLTIDLPADWNVMLKPSEAKARRNTPAIVQESDEGVGPSFMSLWHFMVTHGFASKIIFVIYILEDTCPN